MNDYFLLVFIIQISIFIWLLLAYFRLIIIHQIWLLIQWNRRGNHLLF